MHYLSEEHITIFLIQVFLILALAKLARDLFRKFDQPPMVGEILVGIILGPTIFGRLLPDLHKLVFPANPIQQNMLETLAWFGVMLFLLVTGFEVDTSTAWKQRKASLKIAITGVVFPLAMGFLIFLLLPQGYFSAKFPHWTSAFFMGVAISISALAVIARTLYDLNLLRTDLGLLTLSAITINDILGWFFFSIAFALTTGGTFHSEIGKISITILFTILFPAFCLTIGRRLVGKIINKIVNSNLSTTGSMLTFICCLGLICGAITQSFGIHAIFGFFLAGIMAGDAPDLSENTRQIITQMVHAILIPLFFVSIGLKVDFANNFNMGLVILISSVAIIGKFLGAWFGARMTDLTKDNRLAIAILHTPGGDMTIVVSIVGLELGIITKPLFVALVVAALLSTIIVGPWLSRVIKRSRQIRIKELLPKEGVVTKLLSKDRRSIIHEMSYIAANTIKGIDLDPETVFRAVLDRENLMGTGIDKGIAVPHARLKNLKKPLLVFGHSEAGIDWDAADGKPVHCIFLLLTPEGSFDTQIQTLAAIAKMMKDEKNCLKLASIKNPKELWDQLHTSL
ncbi:MAG: cation:proton antiporter [Pseudomonadota bacterium]